MRITILIIFLLSCVFIPFASSSLSVGFYTYTCPMTEAVVTDVVQRHFAQNISITGGLLRMHFHDCFVRGCDASILIDPTSSRTSEKTAIPNHTVRGYEVIDEAKSILEQNCPSIVSCADILTLATRDAVAMAGGPIYVVPTGRRDGLISNPLDANQLPGPQLNVSEALPFFTSKGFTLDEMVTLMGAHTVGFSHCSFFKDRLVKSDPTMDPSFRVALERICGNSSLGDPSTFLDATTPYLFDSQFYSQIIQRRGVLNIDQQLALDPSTKVLVSSFANDVNGFQKNFADAMIKMGSLGVLVGNEGEIRKNCRAFNFPLEN